MTDSWNSLGRKKFEFILAYQFLFVSTFHYLSFRTEADSVFYFFNFPLLLLSLEVLILLIKNKNIKKQEKTTKMVACAAGGCSETSRIRTTSKCSVSKLVNWQTTYMIFWIMFNVIWLREFCGWLSYLEYEQ